jgi:hypothetical protein
MATEESTIQKTVTTDQQTPTNGQNVQSQSSQASGPAQTAAPSESATIQFSKEQYSAQRRTLITVTRTGSSEGEVTVDFSATEEGDAEGCFLKSQKIVIGDGEDSKTFPLTVKPNWSEATTKVRIKLSNPHDAQLGDPHEAVVLIEPIGYFKGVTWGFATNPRVGRVAKHIVLGTLLILCIYLADRFVESYADRHKTEWDTNLHPDPKQELAFPEKTSITDAEKARFKDQLHRIQQKEEFHLKLMEFYYTGYYIGIIILSFTAALAAITLVIISKGGWAQTSEYVITTFFIMTCAALFYGSWAGLFKQDENITNNKVLYLKYTTLENELRGYTITNEALNYNFVSLADLKPQPASTPNPKDSSTTAQAKSPEEQEKATNEPSTKPTQETATKIGIPVRATDFIHYVDLQLAQDNIAIGFDYNQIPNYKNAFANIGNTK